MSITLENFKLPDEKNKLKQFQNYHYKINSFSVNNTNLSFLLSFF